MDQPGALFGAGGGEELVSSESDGLPGYAVADKADAVAGVDLGLENGADVCYVGFDGGGRVVVPACGEFDRYDTVAMGLEVGGNWLEVEFGVPAASNKDDACLRHVCGSRCRGETGEDALDNFRILNLSS